MIEGNVIKFGYGTTFVTGDSMGRRLIIEYGKPPQEIGKQLTEKDSHKIEVIERVIFRFHEDMHEFLNELSHVNENNYKIKFRDYIFDFTNYNEKSVDVVVKAATKVIRGWQFALAC